MSTASQGRRDAEFVKIRSGNLPRDENPFVESCATKHETKIAEAMSSEVRFFIVVPPSGFWRLVDERILHKETLVNSRRIACAERGIGQNANPWLEDEENNSVPVIVFVCGAILK